MRTRIAAFMLMLTGVLGMFGACAQDASAHNGDIVVHQNCFLGNASVSLSHNVTIDRLVIVETTIPGVIGLSNGHFDSSYGQIWSANWSGVKTGTVSLYIVKPNLQLEFAAHATLPVPDCNPTTTTTKPEVTTSTTTIPVTTTTVTVPSSTSTTTAPTVTTTTIQEETTTTSTLPDTSTTLPPTSTSTSSPSTASTSTTSIHIGTAISTALPTTTVPTTPSDELAFTGSSDWLSTLGFILVGFSIALAWVLWLTRKPIQ